MRVRPFALVAIVIWCVLGVSAPAVAQFSTDGDEELASKLRLRKSDPASLWRFLQFAGGAIGVAMALYFGHRIVQQRLPKKQRSGGRRMSGWQRTLQGYGLDAAEREFIARLGAPHDLAPTQLVTDRPSFERAVESSPELHGDQRQERMLASVRRKLGWDQAVGAADMVPTRVDGIPTLELNQEVELFGVGDHAGFCARGILVHRDDQNLVFRLLDGQEDIPFGPEDSVQIYFWRANDAGYLCTTQVRELRPKGHGFLITMLPNAVERQQKRIYVRVPYSESIRYLHVPLNSASEMLGSEPRGGICDGVCEDLSAGGFRLTTEALLEPGDYLSIPDFEAAGTEEIMARVVNVLEALDDGRRRYGVQYTGIPVYLRDAISRRVFALQREAIVEERRLAQLANAPAEVEAVSPTATLDPSSPGDPNIGEVSDSE